MVALDTQSFQDTLEHSVGWIKSAHERSCLEGSQNLQLQGSQGRLLLQH